MLTRICWTYLLFVILIHLLHPTLISSSFRRIPTGRRKSIIGQNTTNWRALNILLKNRSLTTSTQRTLIVRPGTVKTLGGTLIKDTIPLSSSDCFCQVNTTNSLVKCTSQYENGTSLPIENVGSGDRINVTIRNCTFFNKNFDLSYFANKNINYLTIEDINYNDYLFFNRTSFSSCRIMHIGIQYHSIQSTTIIFSKDAFSSRQIQQSLKTVSIDSCYLVTLNKPFTDLHQLESIILNNIPKFSWHDFQQEIQSLPNLQTISINQENIPLKDQTANVLSCNDISANWTLNYNIIQACSCDLIAFLGVINISNINEYTCPNSNSSITLLDDICQFNGRKYRISNNTDLFCNKCMLNYCSNRTICTEVENSEPICLPLSTSNFDTLEVHIPLTSLINELGFHEIKDQIIRNLKEESDVNNLRMAANMLVYFLENFAIDSSEAANEFYQTFSEFLHHPLMLKSHRSITNTLERQELLHIRRDLIIALEDSILNINNNQPKVEFQSKILSMMSLNFPSDSEQSMEMLQWKVTYDNILSKEVFNAHSNKRDIASRIVLRFQHKRSYPEACNSPNELQTCMNSYSIASLRSPQLFTITDRIPEYDVISILTPHTNQATVSFYFDLQSSSIIKSKFSKFIENSTERPSFYDRLDRKVLQECANPSHAFEIFSWIGCIFSIIGLSITLIIFVLMNFCQQTKTTNPPLSSTNSSSTQELRRRMMNKPRHLSIVKSMLFILCTLLILMNIFILILTFVKPGRNLKCKIISALLYYLTLTAFIWKLLFALQQSIFLTNIFQSRLSNQTLFTIYLIFTFSTPILPLFIIFFKYEDSTFLSSECNYCWFSSEFLLYGLIIPILSIICLNIVFYLYTMIYLCIRNRQQVGLRSTKSEQSRRVQNFKIGLFFAIIMGFSWILGFLILIPNTNIQIFGNILFSIVNSFQGFAFSLMVFIMIERKSFLHICCCYLCKHKSHMKTTMNSQSIVQQESLPVSNDNTRVKKRSNSSMNTSSTTSSGEITATDVFHYRRHKKPIFHQRNK